ncbi:TMV resistance protein N-like [Solanum tuberosum]|uniref:TMV resistance protein N-like n=1 Tax=Solanum tuberosum TaxID=4113 RepID=UPI0003D26CFC|nr:PREDICTED: TMV resistance protein N-like [Solanum tuberosum]
MTTTKQLAYDDQSFNNSKGSYDVFLSFKCEDTGKTFTDHLSTALKQAGFCTFKGGGCDDIDESRRGENINSESIQESKMCIIVFSQNYASSGWCLDQLVSILERKMKFACMILPIFYHVDPSNLRKLKGSIGEALDRHEEKFKCTRNEKEYWEDKLKKWKNALSQVADLAGMFGADFGGWCCCLCSSLVTFLELHESTFIKKIINVISTRLSRPALYIASCSIGIHRRARPINSWVQADVSNNSNIEILLVCGIGKTTIAKIVYNLNFGYFEISCFLANIRETSKLPNGLITLQKQLLSILLKNEKVKISSVDEGIIKIRNALCNRKVLLVLDDVDEPDLVEAIFDMKDWFGFGSKIIVTTRHKSLLRLQLGHEVHEVGILYTIEANELFNFHAFGHENINQISEDKCYKEYSKEVIEWCGGLPLALQVIGSSLAGKSKDVWRSATEKLRDIPTNKIVDKLRLSYELLEDDHDQNLFLHLSCFFVWMKKDFVVRILDKCEFYTLVGLQNLIDRSSLVTIDDYVNDIRMHQLVRAMGRDIVRREAPTDPGKHSRLWHHANSYNVLRGKTGTESVQGMVLDMRMIKKEKYSSPLTSVKQKISTAWSTKLGNSSLQDHVKTDAFEKMHKLQFLRFNKVQVNGSYKNFPKGLRWLCWSGFPEECIPNEFPMRNVVSIDMRYSSLKQLWNGYKAAQILNTYQQELDKLTSLKELYADGINLGAQTCELNASGCISLEKVASNCAKGYPVEGYINCNKLIEVEGVFKLEPLENAGAQLLAFMGISNLQPMTSMMVSLLFGRVSNIVGKKYPSFVRDDVASLFSLSPNKLPPQILYHCGVFSTFLPGESVPNWFRYKFTDAADVYCTLPNNNVNSHRVINGLSICFVYKCPEAYINVGLYDGPAIWLRNQTKDLNWAFYPAWFGLPEDDQSGMMWLSYWKVENLFQQGDVIEVMGSPQFAEFKELGVKIFYLDEQTENYYDSNVMMSTKSNKPFEDILGYYFDDEVNTYYICI